MTGQASLSWMVRWRAETAGTIGKVADCKNTGKLLCESIGLGTNRKIGGGEWLGGIPPFTSDETTGQKHQEKEEGYVRDGRTDRFRGPY